ncbi:replication factor A-like protein [Trichoderma reesei QM6a]|uniref:Replication protein A subunit n=2 Tax=Hypocrea jecorina TaxID=51453 RepID=G0R7W1_HYPJQ|nr:replication factor A-like protein [Trichoderma reesei QM6a]EGR53134.1 replication factor A-like protein [Trichoderma reesei QM6a]ETR99877.1 replication factor-a protein [Trichoderma reesei RUT C-30]
MDAESALSRGCIAAIFNDPDQAAKQFPVPVMQCLQIKQMAPSGQGGDRYRLVMSDGVNYVQTMLATQANHVIHDNKLERGCLTRVKQYTPNNLKGKNILVILDLEVIESLGVHEKIGDPVVLEPRAAETTIAGNDFYGAKKEEQDVKPQMQQLQSMPSRSATHSGANIYPIEALSPFSSKWTIKARVTFKSDIKTWHKPTGEGKLFSVNLLDESGEIKATGFNDQCDAFYDILQEGSVYYISSPCRVSLAKKQFSNLPNDYELAFERETVIEKAEDQTNVPQVRFNFCTIQELQSVEKDSTVDVIGVLKEVGEVSEITSKKDGRPFQKRELTLVDDTGYSVRVTIWGKTASSFDANPESVVAFKGTKVSDFGGKSLSLLSSGTMTVDPDIPDAYRLKGWYDSVGRTDTFATHQNLAGVAGATGRKEEIKTIAQVKDENLGVDDQAYYTIKATIVFVKQDSFCYPACSNQGCNKKVTPMPDGTWQCEKCSVSHDKPDYRYIMQLNVADHTSHQWLSCFDDTGRIIVGMSANELMELKENDDAKFMAAFEAVNCKKLMFRCRAKMDNFGDTQRVRYQVMSASLIDYKSEGHKLVELIKQFNI